MQDNSNNQPKKDYGLSSFAIRKRDMEAFRAAKLVACNYLGYIPSNHDFVKFLVDFFVEKQQAEQSAKRA